MQDSRIRSSRAKIVFKEENLLHTFCAILAQNDLPFAYGAGLSVSIPRQAFERFPPWIRVDFEKYIQEGKVVVTDQPSPSGSRRVPSPEEVRNALRQILPKDFLPKE